MSNMLRVMALVALGLLAGAQHAASGGTPNNCICFEQNGNTFCTPGCLPPIAVPEPGTLALAAAGIGALAWARFRKRKKNHNRE